MIWITGLSGSGKTTLALEVGKTLRDEGRNVINLDGDQLRKVFGHMKSEHKSYEREGRMALAMCYSRLCETISEQGITVVVSTISMFSEVFRWNRENLLSYFEVYLDVPLEERKRWDKKNIYNRYYEGKLRNVAGLDLLIDEPLAPHWQPIFDRDQ